MKACVNPSLQTYGFGVGAAEGLGVGAAVGSGVGAGVGAALGDGVLRKVQVSSL